MASCVSSLVEVRCSIRTRGDWDATVLAGKFGGGGHIRAAGCTIKGSMGTAKRQMRAAVKALLEQDGPAYLRMCRLAVDSVTDETPGYMQELAAQLDARIRNMMNVNDRTSLVMATVMTALQQADEAKKAAQSADNLRKQLKTFFDDNNRTRVESESLRREVAQLRKEKEELERKLAMR